MVHCGVCFHHSACLRFLPVGFQFYTAKYGKRTKGNAWDLSELIHKWKKRNRRDSQCVMSLRSCLRDQSWKHRLLKAVACSLLHITVFKSGAEQLPTASSFRLHARSFARPFLPRVHDKTAVYLTLKGSHSITVHCDNLTSDFFVSLFCPSPASIGSICQFPTPQDQDYGESPVPRRHRHELDHQFVRAVGARKQDLQACCRVLQEA